MSDSRIYLRLIEESDIERTHAWINTPEINDIMGYLPMSLAQQRQWFTTTLNTQTKYVFAICLTDGNEHIGNAGLGKIDYINRNAMFSIFIYDRKYRGIGLGREATEATLAFAFNRLNLHKVFLKTSIDAAARMYERIGFVKEGVQREHEFKDGRYIDKVLFGLLRTEYNRRASPG